jgi:hypothetical protein
VATTLMSNIGKKHCLSKRFYALLRVSDHGGNGEMLLEMANTAVKNDSARVAINLSLT